MRTSHIFSAVGSRQSRWQSDGDQNEKAEQKKKKGGGLGGVQEPCRRRLQNKQSRNRWPALRQWATRISCDGYLAAGAAPLPKPLQTEWAWTPSWDGGLADSCREAETLNAAWRCTLCARAGTTRRTYRSVKWGSLKERERVRTSSCERSHDDEGPDSWFSSSTLPFLTNRPSKKKGKQSKAHTCTALDKRLSYEWVWGCGRIINRQPSVSGPLWNSQSEVGIFSNIRHSTDLPVCAESRAAFLCVGIIWALNPHCKQKGYGTGEGGNSLKVQNNGHIQLGIFIEITAKIKCIFFFLRYFLFLFYAMANEAGWESSQKSKWGSSWILLALYYE